MLGTNATAVGHGWGLLGHLITEHHLFAEGAEADHDGDHDHTVEAGHGAAGYAYAGATTHGAGHDADHDHAAEADHDADHAHDAGSDADLRGEQGAHSHHGHMHTHTGIPEAPPVLVVIDPGTLPPLVGVPTPPAPREQAFGAPRMGLPERPRPVETPPPRPPA